jgi:hypothetical protein
MKIKVEIDTMDLFTMTEIAQTMAAENGWKLKEVVGNIGVFWNPESEMYGSEEYRIDLSNGFTQGRDDGGEWTNEPLPTDCPLGDKDWSQIAWVKAEDGTLYAVN